MLRVFCEAGTLAVGDYSLVFGGLVRLFHENHVQYLRIEKDPGWIRFTSYRFPAFFYW